MLVAFNPPFGSRDMQNSWKEANQLNKEAIFAALATAGITEVTVPFDGYGDSGQIDDMTARVDDRSVELPNVLVTIHERSYSPADAVESVQQPLREAVETLCYDYLEDSHPGWEIDGGSYGEFHFDVRGRTVRLEYNARITEILTEEDEF